MTGVMALLYLYIQPSKGYASSAETEKGAGGWAQAGEKPSPAPDKRNAAPAWRIADLLRFGLRQHGVDHRLHHFL